MRSSGSTCSKGLKELLEEADVHCPKTDKTLVHTALIHCFEEDLTLASEDYHLLLLVEYLKTKKSKLEKSTDTKISIGRPKKFWHGFIAYVFNFYTESAYY